MLEATADRAVIAADPEDLAFVTLSAGRRRRAATPRPDRAVTVTVEGPGVLLGLGSANPSSEEQFTARFCTTFDGRALAVVRPTGPGTSSLRASAEGCEPQQIEIDAHA